MARIGPEWRQAAVQRPLHLMRSLRLVEPRHLGRRQVDVVALELGQLAYALHGMQAPAHFEAQSVHMRQQVHGTRLPGGCGPRGIQA